MQKNRLDFGEAQVHRPKRERPHIAQEIYELYGNTLSVDEHMRKLLPSVRHRAVGVKHYVHYSRTLNTHVNAF